MSGKKHVTIEIITSEYIEIEQDIYEKAEQVFAKHGLTFKQAIEEFFRHSVTHGVPFTAEDIAAYEAEIAQEQGEAPCGETDVPEGDAPVETSVPTDAVPEGNSNTSPKT